MKPVKFVIVVMLCVASTYAYTQGASCNNPHVLALDSVSRNFTVSPTSGNAAECSSGFSGNGKITIFSFTTNASGSCVLVNIATSAPVQVAEVALYTGCGGTGTCQGLQTGSSVCFVDGTGYWAPSQTLTLSPNTTYYLRVWTPDAGTITMSATNYPPPNNLCSGASWISENVRDDNNACAKPSAEVTPVQLCAFSLENTAFYTYIVESNGVTSIQLNDINCDNLNSAAETGFQIGFFVGTCGSLIKISCATGAGGSFTSTTGILSAGTQVFVAIDGTAGSNCSYKITAFNATVLPITLKYFTAWKRPDANRLTWLTTSENDFSHFEVEKSTDGVNFIRVGTKAGNGDSNKETIYVFDDYEIKALQYYRLKSVDAKGQYTYSNVLRVNRDDVTNTKVVFSNRISNILALRIIDMPTNDLSIKIIDNSGREIKSQKVKINPGENSFNINTSPIPAGFYFMILSADNYKRTFSFVKS
ncbi:MAG TPA: T9SS type A sorting domain-containing protein [Chitinophagaceae bacterium]|nr:T9SS type A sorting domain-containing protein [Chitinophagaceae bacterium]